MNIQNKSKINKLVSSWRKGTIAVYSWLKEQGIYRQLVETYIKSGWIERIGQGAFKRPDENIDWKSALYAMQYQLNLSVHPASKTALQLQGNAHYLPADLKEIEVIFFGLPNEILPRWFKNYNWKVNIRFVMTELFKVDNKLGLEEYEVGDYNIKISSPERAILEFCYEVPQKGTFDELSKIMNGLTTLRPKLVQNLLENCNSIKAKRIFMYLAEKNGHLWLNKLNLKKVNFGTGKRSICKNGVYNNKYKIVIPPSD